MPRTADELERLATAFRPSWELDDAPFTGAATFSAADIRALQGSGPNADLRAAASQPLNGAQHLAPKPMALQEAAAAPSVIVDAMPAAIKAPQAAPPLFAPHVPAAPPPPVVAGRPLSSPPPPPSPWAPPPGYEQQPRTQSRAPSSTRTTTTVPPSRTRAPAVDVESSTSFRQPPKKGLWIGLSVAAVVVGGAAVWALSGSPEKPEVPAVVRTAKPAAQETKVSSIPPPPPETSTAQAAPAPAVPAAAPVTATPVAAVPVAALPVAPATAMAAPPAPHNVPAAAPQPPARSAYTPPARPAPRKGPSIVRDVPF
jgi:hypothetical protein